MAKDLRSRKSGMGGTKPFAKKPEIDPRQEAVSYTHLTLPTIA